MATATAERMMAKRDDVSVKIDKMAADVARRAASLMNKTLAEYLSEVVLSVARADLVSAAKQIVKDDEPKPKR